MIATSAALRLHRQLVDAVGADQVLTSPEEQAPYLVERRGLFHGRAAAVVRPATTAAVAAVVRACADGGFRLVPQGGNTGLCGGAAPDASATEVIVALERLNQVRELDADNYTLTAEAGCVLAHLQRVAAGADRLLPLSYAAESYCQIGGNLATNAGGMNVLRYGNARDLTLGLEVVLPDGRVWDGLTALRKDNSGYDLKDLFIGAEGTLGIITAAVLKLFPAPRHHCTLILGLAEAEAAVTLLARLRTASGDALSAYELMSRTAIEFTRRHEDGLAEPFQRHWPWYVIADLVSSRAQDDLDELATSTLLTAYREGLCGDWRVTTAADAREAIWRYRKAIPAAQREEGGSIKHDVSVPVSRVPEFLDRATQAVTQRLPGVRPCAFGHVGDGNLHFNLSQPDGMETGVFLERWDELNWLVHDIAITMGGSFAAEHGVGRLKPAEVARLKSSVEVDLMRRIKQALDPEGRMNPGKVIPPDGGDGRRG